MGIPVVLQDRTLTDEHLEEIDPGTLDLALNTWNQAWGAKDEALAMDGKTMKNAIDDQGNQTHIMSVVGHESKRSYAQKKVGTLPVAGSDEQKRTNEIGKTIPVLETFDIQGKDLTSDALLTQRAIATYVVEHKAPTVYLRYRRQSPSGEGDSWISKGGLDGLSRCPSQTTEAMVGPIACCDTPCPAFHP